MVDPIALLTLLVIYKGDPSPVPEK
jgi:hypothetical protein